MGFWPARRGEKRARTALGPGVLLLSLAFALAPASPANAQPTRADQAAATALFDEGRKLLAEKKFAEACPKLEAAMGLAPGMGTLFNLSDCYEKIGRTASAWSGFRDVASQARAANKPDHEQAARERAAALEGKLSKVRLVVPAELASVTLTITRDGAPLPSALVGTPIPLDPGLHTLRVVAEGREPWETKITVSAQGGTMDVPVPVLAPKVEGPASTTAPSASSAPSVAPTSVASAAPSIVVTSAPTSSGDVGPPRPWQKPLGIAVAAAGVAGLGVGVVFGFIAAGTRDESNKVNCKEDNTCNPEGLAQRQTARNQGDIGTVIGTVGAVIGAAGILLWIAAPSAPAAPAKSGVVSNVRVGASPGGLVISGRF